MHADRDMLGLSTCVAIGRLVVCFQHRQSILNCRAMQGFGQRLRWVSCPTLALFRAGATARFPRVLGQGLALRCCFASPACSSRFSRAATAPKPTTIANKSKQAGACILAGIANAITCFHGLRPLSHHGLLPIIPLL
jgi:hypothetical protein